MIRSLLERRSAIIAGVVAAAWFALLNRDITGGRQDYVYLADAMLHGRLGLTQRLGFVDVVVANGLYFLPFAPLPAFLFVPFVWLVGIDTTAHWTQLIDAVLAGAAVGGMWALFGRIGVRSIGDRAWLALLFAISTPLSWAAVRGSVWQEGQVITTVLTVFALVELWGARRAWLVGLLAGGAFLTRGTLAAAIPVYALLLVPDEAWFAVLARGRATGTALLDRVRALPWLEWAYFTLGVLPSVAIFTWYNEARFGDPLQTGYSLAQIPDFLDVLRRQGLFSVAHLSLNLDYFLFHLPSFSTTYPFLRPDGFGMSLFLTSPGLFLALRADWRSRRVLLLWLGLALTLIPSLLYYGGGWVQFGFRYFLDSAPFAVTLCACAAAYRGRIGLGWKALIVVGVAVGMVGVYWASRI